MYIQIWPSYPELSWVIRGSGFQMEQKYSAYYFTYCLPYHTMVSMVWRKIELKINHDISSMTTGITNGTHFRVICQLLSDIQVCILFKKNWYKRLFSHLCIASYPSGIENLCSIFNITQHITRFINKFCILSWRFFTLVL